MSVVNHDEMPNPERWLECQLDHGMFSDELAVTYPPEGRVQTSVFVAKNEVRGLPGNRGRVRVHLIHRDGNVIAVLPTSRRDMVTISVKDITKE